MPSSLLHPLGLQERSCAAARTGAGALPALPQAARLATGSRPTEAASGWARSGAVYSLVALAPEQWAAWL